MHAVLVERKKWRNYRLTYYRVQLCFRIVWGYTEITPIMEYYDVIKNIVQSILQHVKGYQITILIFSHHHHSLRRSEAILSPVALRINNFKKTLS